MGIAANEYWSKGGAAFHGFSTSGKNDQSGDPQVDAMIEKARLERDTEKRKALVFDLQRYLAKAHVRAQPARAAPPASSWPGPAWATSGSGKARAPTTGCGSTTPRPPFKSVLTKEDNEILNHVGPGTPMGNLLRRYWMPALLSDELPEPDCTPVRVRLLGEDLVAFRDTEGSVGLVDSNCPHRGSLDVLRPQRRERPALRLPRLEVRLHGPVRRHAERAADQQLQERLKIPAYPTHESGGIVWTYMGPKDKMTGFRDFGTEGLPREKWRARKQFQPMTWMQWMEGLMDTTHNSWLHHWKGRADLEDDGSDAPGVYNSGMAQWKFWGYDQAPDIRVVETWHGFRAAGLRKTPNGNTARPPVCLHHALPLRTGRPQLHRPDRRRHLLRLSASPPSTTTCGASMVGVGFRRLRGLSSRAGPTSEDGSSAPWRTTT